VVLWLVVLINTFQADRGLATMVEQYEVVVRSRIRQLVILVAWCVLLLVTRVIYSGTSIHTFLVVNLSLAIVPAIAGLMLRRFAFSRGNYLIKIICFLFWFCFLPNAPYLITDLVHLQQMAPVPLWFDVALFASFSATGVFLCYASVADVHVALSKMSRPAIGSLVAFGSLLLSGFGMYLGRFPRLNSWSLLTAPWSIVEHIARCINPVVNPKAWVFSIIYGFGLALGYWVLRELALSLPKD